MPFEDPPDYCKTETFAGDRAFGFEAVVEFENLFLVTRSNADSVVFNAIDRYAIFNVAGYMYLSLTSGVAIFQCIVNKIAEYLIDL